MKPRKQNFFQLKRGYGGSYGRRGSRTRPFHSKHSIHTVLRSKQARGRWSFLHIENKKATEQILYKQARKFNIKIYKLANVGNHFHLSLQSKSKREFSNFLRAVTGLIARHVTKSERGRKLEKSFWDHRPFTRIVQWGRDFENVLKYITKNRWEGIAGCDGITPEEFPGYSKINGC